MWFIFLNESKLDVQKPHIMQEINVVNRKTCREKENYLWRGQWGVKSGGLKADHLIPNAETTKEKRKSKLMI